MKDSRWADRRGVVRGGVDGFEKCDNRVRRAGSTAVDEPWAVGRGREPRIAVVMAVAGAERRLKKRSCRMRTQLDGIPDKRRLLCAAETTEPQPPLGPSKRYLVLPQRVALCRAGGMVKNGPGIG